MAEYTRPDVYIEEKDKAERPIEGASTSITGFVGIAEKGPINVPLRVTGVEDFKAKFGNALEGHALFYSVKGFFQNGGSVAYVVRVAHYADVTDKATQAGATASRNLTGIGNAAYATYTGDVDVTSVDLVAELDAAFGTLQMQLDINNGGPYLFNWMGTRASVTGAIGNFTGATFVGGEWIDVIVDGGDTQRITFDAGDDASEATALAKLNGLLGAKATGSGGGALTLQSDTMGNNSSIEVAAVSAVSVTNELGLSADVNAVVGEAAADFSALTFAEIKAHIEDQVKLVTPGDLVAVTQSPAGYLVLTVTTGDAATSELSLEAPTPASIITAFGLSGLGSQGANPEAIGTAASAQTAFVLKSGYRSYESPGTLGNSTQVEVTEDPEHPSQGVGNDIASNIAASDTLLKLTTLKGIRVGSVLKFDGGGNTEYAIVTKAETKIVGGVAEHQVTVSAGMTNSFDAGLSSCQSVEFTVIVSVADVEVERWEHLSVNSAAGNYLLNVLNDKDIGSVYLVATDSGVAFPGNVLHAHAKAALTGGSSEIAGITDTDVVGDSNTKVGIHALDGVQSVNLLCIPPSRLNYTGINASTTVHHKMLDWCAARMNCWALLDAPEVLSPATSPITPTQAATYRNDRLGADSPWGGLYYPFVQVPDPLGSGRAPVTWMPPSGHMAGIFARVDAIDPPEGGVSAAPAGIEFGKVKGVTDVRHAVSDAEQDILNPLGVNCIREFAVGGPGGQAPGLVLFGARTLSTGKPFRYIQVRRMLNYIEQSIRLGTLWAVFKNNDFRLWGRLTRNIERFLRGLHQAGQLYGRTAEEAYFVKIDDSTTTADDIDNGRLVGEIGVALIRPAEFVIFRFSQLQGGSTIEE